ncbi:cytochrome b5 domain-containing protein [Candidatus Nitrotoga sp. M5]|uniref:cytochrome b5 domain-containing protein n=1 Tax=Candidatus Nitrotoga sp. M5 TaxID=2890409 RepID=UPI001EF23467|nr:cytochrome b5-like heme/steroid binding domain-containing protein [Candidatus Nitrotoga sp. M5]CAH1386066.1 Cytochrome b5-like Heme/Steroid binding domain-containing protein [Candidatus Nitrotoga sp. M5]
MRLLYIFATLIFWLLVAAFWAGSLWLPPAEKSAAIAVGKSISPTELAKHSTPENCWVAIRGNVYDLSAYLPKHPSQPDILPSWCGKEATEAYNTKTKGRPHSIYADELLIKYQIGILASGKS